METQKILKFLSSPKLATKKWNVFDSESKRYYSNEDAIKFLTKSIESSLGGYSDAYILVTGNITVTWTIAADPNVNLDVEKKKKLKQALIVATQFLFKNCAPFKSCRTEMTLDTDNDTFVDYAEFINIKMLMYNLIECSYG